MTSSAQFSRIQVGNAPAYVVALDPEATDPLTQALRTGFHPYHYIADLIASLVGPTERVVDVGAHVGSIGLCAAAAGAEVLAIEGSQTNAELIRQAVTVNHFRSVDVLNIAVSDHEGELAFIANGPWGHLSTQGELAQNPAIARMACASLDSILDRLQWTNVRLVKIDIEGGEYSAFQGAQRLLGGDDAPYVVYESNEVTSEMMNHTSIELMEVMEKFGYRHYIIKPDHRLIPAAVGYFQTETIVDYLCAKRDLPPIPGWSVTSPLSASEVIDEIVAECEFPVAAHRASIGARLRRAPSWCRSDSRVLAAVRALTQDSEESVRTAVQWSAS
ncbi:MAG: FkbM family methyltransferase [Chloroflexota bacterium]